MRKPLAIILDYMDDSIGADATILAREKGHKYDVLRLRMNPSIAGAVDSKAKMPSQLLAAVSAAGNIENTKIYICGHGAPNDVRNIYPSAEADTGSISYLTITRDIHRLFSPFPVLPPISMIVCFAARTSSHTYNHDYLASGWNYWYRMDIKASLLYRLAGAIFLVFERTRNISMVGLTGAVSLNGGRKHSGRESVELLNIKASESFGTTFSALSPTQQVQVGNMVEAIGAEGVIGTVGRSVDQVKHLLTPRVGSIRQNYDDIRSMKGLPASTVIADPVMDAAIYKYMTIELGAMSALPHSRSSKYNKLKIRNAGNKLIAELVYGHRAGVKVNTRLSTECFCDACTRGTLNWVLSRGWILH